MGGIHRRSDDEYRQLLAWTPTHIPQGSTVAVTDYTAQFLLQGLILGQWATVPALIKTPRGLCPTEHHAGQRGIWARNATVRAIPGGACHCGVRSYGSI